eukprot:TRINITY_DN27734_c0_g1_i1.p1 TRINITY_DN27734_c0_g1~~TRINITY_DN27734_c0_g1_i1.p1  ORF type:complete len:185 (+),score=12.22 TRINITY_DN27734_c0_g1_i1:45-599(+)
MKNYKRFFLIVGIISIMVPGTLLAGQVGTSEENKGSPEKAGFVYWFHVGAMTFTTSTVLYALLLICGNPQWEWNKKQAFITVSTMTLYAGGVIFRVHYFKETTIPRVVDTSLVAVPFGIATALMSWCLKIPTKNKEDVKSTCTTTEGQTLQPDLEEVAGVAGLGALHWEGDCDNGVSGSPTQAL